MASAQQVRPETAIIAHILPFPGIGGTELQTLRLVETARSLGYNNVVYYPDQALIVRDLFEDHHFETEAYPQIQPSLHAPMPFLKASREIARSLRRRRVRLIHCADILAAHFAGIGARMAGARVVSHVRNPYPDLSRRERAVLLNVHQFVFISKAVREALCLPSRRKNGPVIYDVPGAMVAAVRSRAESRRFFGLPDAAPVVGVAARLSPQKDYPTLIRAAKILAEALPDVRFLVAADTSDQLNREYIQQSQSLIEETGMRAHFHFPGFQKDMSWFFAAIDCLALSSNVEGLGSVLLDGIRHGTPLVGTNVDGIPEVILDEQTGLLSRPHSPDHLAAQIRRLLTDRALATRLRSAASAHLENTFGEERFVRQIRDFYSSFNLRTQP